MRSPPALDAGRHALFLDFDGTLVGFADDPAAVRLPSVVRDRLIALQRELGGALAVVSGRRIADLDRFLLPLKPVLAGVHGLERRGASDEATRLLMTPDALDAVRERLQETVRLEPRLGLEDKGTALVLHYRRAPDLAETAARAMREAAGGRDDLVVMVGNAIVEVHPAGMDKGRALADFMAEPPFRGRQPVYLGDDTTDEFALDRVREMGGVSVKVGPGVTAAEYHLADVAAVHRWLGAGSQGEGAA
ncbi:trehalose-phosphatase [Aureimonas leprariae]|uniref:Trehalose 6-phosphate phosphatase n=1 Tax=Plantimonas leprariae TaxID=2615207 RepID=A0A7V7PM99_9HYPH|nr:trehalose-phosphatase [Aureimonas leprariae]KAB0677983.1 trehalose-phosphatase [Aureimonas leprariae]